MYYAIMGATLSLILLFSWSAGEEGRLPTKWERRVRSSFMVLAALIVILCVIGFLMNAAGSSGGCTYQHGAQIGDC